MSDKLITIAIHTYSYAVALRTLLEREGIAVSLQNLHPDNPVVASGVRVRINEDDLPLALRIIENSEIFLPDNDTSPNGAIGVNNSVYLIPIDFTPHSLKACDLAFELAHQHNATLQLINTVVDTAQSDFSPLADTIEYSTIDQQTRATMFNEAYTRMKQLTDTIRDRIKSGTLPPVRFKADVIEGLPEEVIIQYARENRPDLIIMGTRSRAAKERDMIGSVTAEVLDSCRIPVITLPQDIDAKHVVNMSHVMMFCNLTQSDLLTIDFLYRTFNNVLDIELIAITDRNKPWRKQRREPADMLLSYCREHYPRFKFNYRATSMANIDSEITRIHTLGAVDLIVTANHRRSPLTRLFNPSIAHRLLFLADTPMAVIPV